MPRRTRIALRPPVAVPFALAALLAVATGIVVTLDAAHAQDSFVVAQLSRAAPLDE